MGKPKINDRKLFQLIDKENKSQSQAAKILGVSRQRSINVFRSSVVGQQGSWLQRKLRRPCNSLLTQLSSCIPSTKSQSGRQYPPLQPGYYKIMEHAFSYMVLGRYPAQGSTQLISKEWIARARSRWDSYVSEGGEVPPQHTSASMGLDVGEFGSDANVACFRYSGFVERLVTWNGIDTNMTGYRAISEYKALSIARANVDATGIGTGIAPYMQRNRCSANIDFRDRKKHRGRLKFFSEYENPGLSLDSFSRR